MSRPTSTSRTLRGTAVLAIAVALILAACGSSDDLDGDLVKDGAGCTPTTAERRSPAPTITPVKKEPTKLSTKDLIEGDGCVISANPYVTLDLVGATAVEGKQFVDTFKPKRPITTTMGAAKLVVGLENGLADMKVGGRRQITIPADQAYAEEGNKDQGIGPDQGLIFIVDLVAVTKAPVYCAEHVVPPAEGDKVPETVDMPEMAPTDKVETTVIREGDGEEVTDKSYVTVAYVGVSCSTGEQFDSSFDRGETFVAAMQGANDSARSVIPGWTQGLVGQKAGSRVLLSIPASEGYGATGQPPAIGPNEALVFLIDVISTTEEAPVVATSTTVAGDPAADPAADAPTTTAAP